MQKCSWQLSKLKRGHRQQQKKSMLSLQGNRKETVLQVCMLKDVVEVGWYRLVTLFCVGIYGLFTMEHMLITRRSHDKSKVALT